MCGRRSWLTDEDAHGNHGVFFDDHAFDDFAACADEAVVLNDRGASLHGFENAADANAAREMAVLADLSAGTHRGPGVNHRARAHACTDINK